MFHIIYAQPLERVCWEILCGLLLWAMLSAVYGKRKPKLWLVGNLIFLAVSLFGVFYATLMQRSPGEHELILTPWYFLTEGKIQPEVYRSLLMNVLLFTPLGLTLSAAWSVRTTAWRSVRNTVLICLGLSLLVETVQYLGGYGRAEVDDLGANTLGALLGALHVPLGALIREKLPGTDDR